MVPTLAILAAPPAIGGMAWLAVNGRTPDWLTTALLGATIFTMLVQIALVPTYRRLQFSLGFWSFTFSMAAVAGQVIILSDIARYPGWQAVVITALVAIYVLIVAIAVASLGARRTPAGGLRYKERQLAPADESVEPMGAGALPSNPPHSARTVGENA